MLDIKSTASPSPIVRDTGEGRKEGRDRQREGEREGGRGREREREGERERKNIHNQYSTLRIKQNERRLINK